MYTVGVIGIGSFGQKRVQALLALDDTVEQVIIFDQDQKRCREFADKIGDLKIKIAKKIDDIFSHPDIFAVCICTPNSTHSSLAAKALKHNIHVLCEKPIAHKTKEVEKLFSLADTHQKYLKAGTNHRFFPSIRYALELVKQGGIGQIVSFHGSIGTDGQRIQNSWFWQKELAQGGTFLDNGHHLLDLAVLFCGPFQTCFGHTSTRQWLTAEVEDYAVAIYATDPAVDHQGYEAILRSSWRQPRGYVDVEIWGTDGWIHVQMGEREIIEWKSGGEIQQLDLSDAPKTAVIQETALFLEECEHQDLHTVEQQTHLRHLTQMIEAFYSSQLGGKRVMLAA
jgi:predicted dehydrogenase